MKIISQEGTKSYNYKTTAHFNENTIDKKRGFRVRQKWAVSPFLAFSNSVIWNKLLRLSEASIYWSAEIAHLSPRAATETNAWKARGSWGWRMRDTKAGLTAQDIASRISANRIVSSLRARGGGGWWWLQRCHSHYSESSESMHDIQLLIFWGLTYS